MTFAGIAALRAYLLRFLPGLLGMFLYLRDAHQHLRMRTSIYKQIGACVSTTDTSSKTCSSVVHRISDHSGAGVCRVMPPLPSSTDIKNAASLLASRPFFYQD